MGISSRNLKTLILGAGPAGSSCAIQLLKAGFKVTLIDRKAFSRHVPGETFHPGIEPLLEKLGVFDSVNLKGFIRHEGIINVTEKEIVFTPYNKDEKWKGFQLFRDEFDSILLNKAIELGADFLAETIPISVELEPNGYIRSISKSEKTLVADYYIDATGKRAWLVNKLKVSFLNHSNQQIAYYGYVTLKEKDELDNPKLIWDENGWTWISKVKKDLISWVRLDLNGHRKKNNSWLPEELKSHQSVGKKRAVDVTWRIADIVSHKNYFFIGDAAFVLDPASSHGVLKAIMSGIKVSHLLSQINNKNLENLHYDYNSWMKSWFKIDLQELGKLYSEKGIKTRLFV